MRQDGTPLLPGIPHRLGRPRFSAAELAQAELAALKQKPLWEIREVFAPWINATELRPAEAGANSRQRVFSLEVVFWAFLYQVLSCVGCTGAVKRVQSWMVERGQQPPSSDTSAYCQARHRLPQDVLDRVFQATGERLAEEVMESERWHGRDVKVVDGTGVSMPDTEKNQAEWPQSTNMTPGCGFPQMKLVGVFSLASGAWLRWAEGDKHSSEQGLWRSLWRCLRPGDLVLGDKLYGAYALMAGLYGRGIDGVYCLSSARKIDWRRGKRLGPRDRLQRWTRPKCRPKGWTAEQWAEVPEEIEVRVLERKVSARGFRVKTLRLVTTLCDPVEYPADDLFELYQRRWRVELHFRDVKITLGMDVLASKTPTQVRKELAMYAICHNLLRGLMQRAAHKADRDLQRLSFQAAASQLREWQWLFIAAADSPAEHRRLLDGFYDALVSAPVPLRPDRNEPRVRKRRPKNYRKMTRPRHTKPAREEAA